MLDLSGEDGRIALPAEAGGEIAFARIAISSDGYWRAFMMVKSDWFQCLVGFECSVERALEFIDALKSVLDEDGGAVNFINEESNVDLDIKLSRLGQVHLTGSVCKSMADDSLVKYELVSDRSALERFCYALAAQFPRS
jgi:hypothetical protein